MANEPGLVAVNVVNASSRDESVAGYYFPVDSEKTVVVPQSKLIQLQARRGLDVDVIQEGVTKADVESLELNKPFSFVADQDQNVTNRSPGQNEDWLAPTHAEGTATPALKHGRLAELRLEKGAQERADELDVDIFSVSGTGEEGQITIANVEDAFEGVVPHPGAGVLGGAVHPHQEGVLAEEVEAPGEEVDASAGPQAASKAAEKKAEQQGIDPALINATGSGGRYTVADVNRAIKAEAEEDALEKSERAAIDHQKEIDTATPPPAHQSGVEPQAEAFESEEEAEKAREIALEVHPEPDPEGRKQPDRPASHGKEATVVDPGTTDESGPTDQTTSGG